MATLKENFKKGDLVYGTESYRRDKINELQFINPPETKFTIDTYNNTTLVKVLDNWRFDLDKERDFLQWLESKDFENENLDKEEVIKHLNAIKNLENYPKLSVTNDARSSKDSERGISREDRKFRRSCKARLAHQNSTIHFLLNEIDIQHTFDRDYSKANRKTSLKKVKEKCYFDSFTSAELRFIFKNYDAIKDHVKLYYDDQEIDLYDWVKTLKNAEKAAIYKWAKQKDETKIANNPLLQMIIQDVLARNSHASNTTNNNNNNNNNVSETPSSPVKEKVTSSPVKKSFANKKRRASDEELDLDRQTQTTSNKLFAKSPKRNSSDTTTTKTPPTTPPSSAPTRTRGRKLF